MNLTKYLNQFIRKLLRRYASKYRMKYGMGIAKTDKLKILADYFGVSIEYFLEEKEEVGE